MAAKKKMNEIAATSTGLIYGSPPYQDHHGSALWMKDAQGWFMVRNLAGIEWSAQFCADPAKVDLLRQNAKRLYDLLAPDTKQELDPTGLLDTPIQDAAGVARWTDSIFNAGVPLQPSFHIGVLPHGGVQASAATTGDSQDALDPASATDGSQVAQASTSAASQPPPTSPSAAGQTPATSVASGPSQESAVTAETAAT